MINPGSDNNEKVGISREFIEYVNKRKHEYRRGAIASVAFLTLLASLVAYEWNKNKEKDQKIKAKIENLTTQAKTYFENTVVTNADSEDLAKEVSEQSFAQHNEQTSLPEIVEINELIDEINTEETV